MARLRKERNDIPSFSGCTSIFRQFANMPGQFKELLLCFQFVLDPKDKKNLSS